MSRPSSPPFYLDIKHCKGASEMSQQIKAFFTKPNDLISSPSTHIVKGENQLPKLAHTHEQL